jgi:hypothetical protein
MAWAGESLRSESDNLLKACAILRVRDSAINWFSRLIDG